MNSEEGNYQMPSLEYVPGCPDCKAASSTDGTCNAAADMSSTSCTSTNVFYRFAREERREE